MSFPCICRRWNSDDGDGDVLQHLLLRHRGLVRLLLHRILRRHPGPTLEHMRYVRVGGALIRNLQNDEISIQRISLRLFPGYVIPGEEVAFVYLLQAGKHNFSPHIFTTW